MSVSKFPALHHKLECRAVIVVGFSRVAEVDKEKSGAHWAGTSLSENDGRPESGSPNL